MNQANITIKKIFSGENELQNLKDALAKDEVIIPAILKIMTHRLRACKPSQEMLRDTAYPYRRAAKDGAQYELEWFMTILTEDKE